MNLSFFFNSFILLTLYDFRIPPKVALGIIAAVIYYIVAYVYALSWSYIVILTLLFTEFALRVIFIFAIMGIPVSFHYHIFKGNDLSPKIYSVVLISIGYFLWYYILGFPFASASLLCFISTEIAVRAIMLCLLAGL
jgi:hypothetical protein